MTDHIPLGVSKQTKIKTRFWLTRLIAKFMNGGARSGIEFQRWRSSDGHECVRITLCGPKYAFWDTNMTMADFSGLIDHMCTIRDAHENIKLMGKDI